MIPKVIHYCWLSGEPLPTEIKECIRSWKRKLPDYKLRLWTQDSLDISSVPFVFEAIKEKKWAFACDYMLCITKVAFTLIVMYSLKRILIFV